MTGIFVSYRREDTAGHAGRLAEQLGARYGHAKVFIDIDSIKPGVDFEQRIHETLSNARVTLVLIGEKWLEVRGADGKRRIDDPDDYVRKEIAEALGRVGSTVIPVLIERSDMPAGAELPPDIAPLAKRNAFKLGNERWRYDVEQLSERIDELTSTGALARSWRGMRRRAALAGAALALAAVALVAALGASSSGGGAPAVNLRVDDIPVSNPLDKYRSSATGPDIQLDSSKPSVDLKIHNLGRQTADVTEARFTVANALQVKPCFSAGGGPLSATYQTLLPTTQGAHIDTVVNEQVKPDEIDRFRVVFDLPLSAFGPGSLDTWLMRLHVQLLHDAAPTPVDGGYILLSFRGAPDAGDSGKWWTRQTAANPGYAKLSQSFGASNIQCVIGQTPTVQRFLALPGRRSQELVDFASQLTTSH